MATSAKREDLPDMPELESAAMERGCAVIHIDTLRRNRRLIYMREWLAAQSPWRRRLASRVQERMRKAA